MLLIDPAPVVIRSQLDEKTPHSKAIFAARELPHGVLCGVHSILCGSKNPAQVGSGFRIGLRRDGPGDPVAPAASGQDAIRRVPAPGEKQDRSSDKQDEEKVTLFHGGRRTTEPSCLNTRYGSQPSAGYRIACPRASSHSV